MTLRGNVGLLFISVSFAACLDTALPPPPGPGTLSGRVVRSVPGFAVPQEAGGATIELMGTSQVITADEDGRFVVQGFTRNSGRLWLRHDADGDGAPESQRILSLDTLGIGPGRHIALGDVALGKNARLEGSVRVSSRSGDDTGHFGTSVVIKGTSFSAFSADNGGFALDALPPGAHEVVFFRAGFAPVVFPLELSSGQRVELQLVLLDPSTDTRPADARGAVQNLAGALSGATVKIIGVDQSTEVTSADDGVWTAAGLEPGLYNLGVEAPGHTSLVFPGVLLVPGPNDVGTVTLLEGTSTPVVVPSPPLRPDAGVDAGSDAGFDGGDDAGFDGGDDAGFDGGDDAGFDAGVDAGFDAGIDAGPPCGAACSSGFACTTRERCETAACALVSCAGACRDGHCYANQCGVQQCEPGDVCDDGACVALACAGVTCPAMSVCGNGRCVSTLCAQGPCANGQVCSNGECVDPRCVDVDCGATASCMAGLCIPNGSQQGCAAGTVLVSGRCVDLRCQGVTCAPGSFCHAGGCTASGLYAAALFYADGNTNNAPTTAILASDSNGWRRINLTVLPRVLRLLISRDGQWLFAHTDDVEGGEPWGSLWRSTDGVTWLRSWAGDTTAGQTTAIAVDHVTGRLFMGIYANPVSSMLVSDDDGATWSSVFTSPAFNGIRDAVRSVAPGWALVSFSNYSTNGLYPADGGVRTPYFFIGTAHLLSDPSGWGATYIVDDQLRALDSGVLGPIASSSASNILYDEAPSRRVHVASSTAIWFSNDGVSSWGQRAVPSGNFRFTSLARGSDGVFYAANAGAQGGAPLLQSFDDGVTWTPVSETWREDATLIDPWPVWSPDAGYNFGMRVRPTVPNGWVYERRAGSPMKATEPGWTTDGGTFIDDAGTTWVTYGKTESRLTALVSRACSVGQQRCGAACVDVASDALNCGGCGVTCSGACQLGRCVGGQDAGVATGCADGTREGFIDETVWPNVAACAGSWAGELTASSADLLCAPGFHVCEPTDLELRVVTYDDATAFPGCFAYRASNDGFDGCDALVCAGDEDHDDMAGVGRGCRALSGVAHQGMAGASSCLADGARVDATCCAASVNGAGCQQTTQSGVVCCAN